MSSSTEYLHYGRYAPTESRAQIREREFDTLARVMDNDPDVTRVEFNRGFNHLACAFRLAMRNNTHVKYVEMQGGLDYIDFEELENLWSVLRRDMCAVTTLCFSSVVRNFGGMFRQCKWLGSLEKTLRESPCSRLSTLDFHGCSVLADGVERYLVPILTHAGSQVRCLNVSRTDVRDDDAQRLVAAAFTSPQRRFQLSLRHCKLTDETLVAVFEYARHTTRDAATGVALWRREMTARRAPRRYVDIDLSANAFLRTPSFRDLVVGVREIATLILDECANWDHAFARKFIECAARRSQIEAISCRMDCEPRQDSEFFRLAAQSLALLGEREMAPTSLGKRKWHG